MSAELRASEFALPSSGKVTPTAPRRSLGLTISMVFAVAMIVIAWVSIIDQGIASDTALVSRQTLSDARLFVERLAGSEESTPAFRMPERWSDVFQLSMQTLAMSILATAIASAGMLLTVIPASRPIIRGDRSLVGRLLFGAIRGLYIFTRSVPELLWALLIVFVISPGMIAGALALAVHNFGILGKLCAETVEHLDRKPLRALQTTGASRGEVLMYAVLPLALPSFLTFILYRWEVIVRTTIVVGFVGAAGLGREFRLSMSFFHYSDITLILIAYVALVYFVDAVSVGLRRLAR